MLQGTSAGADLVRGSSLEQRGAVSIENPFAGQGDPFGFVGVNESGGMRSTHHSGPRIATSDLWGQIKRISRIEIFLDTLMF